MHPIVCRLKAHWAAVYTYLAATPSKQATATTSKQNVELQLMWRVFTNLVGISALKSAFRGVEVLELQLADLAQRVDGVVRELRGDQQLRVSREGFVRCVRTAP